ncbi:hypothetical protein [Phytohabitans kaempferiae]|uniref:Uncharacterized protein n=1 Tax=Phytohabitans kaempferiae TaxID=1620943 RepID=A0ABV6LZ74_9ACTN
MAPPASAQASGTEAASTSGRGRLRAVIGYLAASGVLAAIVAFGLPIIYNAAAGGVGESNGESAVKVTVDDDGGFDPIEGSLWAFANSSPPLGEGDPEEIRAADAVALRAGVVVVTVENVGSRSLTITSIRAIVETPRRDPLAGAILRVAPGGGGGEDPPVPIGFALDTADLEARTTSGDEPSTTHYLDRYGMTLKPGEQMRLRMAGHTRAHDVVWSAVMRHVSDGETHDTPIGAPDQFRVTAASARYASAYEYSTRALRQVPVRDMCGADCRSVRG